MKVLMKPIEMIAWFTKDGVPTPIKYKLYLEDDTVAIIKIDRIIARSEEKLAGNRMFTYCCQSVINGIKKIYEIKYELNTCKWFIYKI